MAGRLDQELVARGLASSRARAQAMVAEGIVRVNGALATKPAQTVTDQTLTLAGEPNPWVSRAALKLVHALDQFALTPGGIAADIGASTGGFTQVLLARGATRVIAVDVGHGQLHSDLTTDPRIDNRPGTNARHLTSDDLPPLDWVVSDVSFISATKALGPALAACRPAAHLVCLVKPQFELTPTQIGKGGIVRDPAAHAQAIQSVKSWLTDQGWRTTGETQSPITGADGNVEFLLAATKV